MSFNDYSGVIHLHTAFSHDGHAPVDNILGAARKNDIDFLMLTDHDNLRAREEGWEGWQDNILVIVGEEIAPRFNHYLAFNITNPILTDDDPDGEKPQKYMDAVIHQGGFGIIAHPDHEGTAMFHVKQYCWRDWTVQGYSAISVLDFMTDWQSSFRGYVSGFFSFLFPAFFLKGPRRITLERWDALNQIRKTVGIGELDNHASTKKIFKIKFVAFPFDQAFKFVRTHILTENRFSGNSQQDTRMIFESLLHGRCYFSLEYFRKAKGFQFFVTQNNETFQMGDSCRLIRDTRLSVHLPEKAYLKIIRNGQIILQSQTDDLSIIIKETGVYRIEASLRFLGKIRPWIFSNPIFLTE